MDLHVRNYWWPEKGELETNLRDRDVFSGEGDGKGKEEVCRKPPVGHELTVEVGVMKRTRQLKPQS